ACALNGLGRKLEAEEVLKRSAATVGTESNPTAVPPDPVPIRGLLCLRDIPKLKELIARSLRSDVIMEGDLSLQPNYLHTAKNAEIWNIIRSDPEIRRLAADRIRTLPPEMSPALNR